MLYKSLCFLLVVLLEIHREANFYQTFRQQDVHRIFFAVLKTIDLSHDAWFILNKIFLHALILNF